MRTHLSRAAGPLVVYSAAFRPFCAALLEGFSQAYPNIELNFVDGISTRLHQAYLQQQAQGLAVPDVIWSSAMDLQMDLVSKNHAQAHASEQVDQLENWANAQNLAFSTTLEPLVNLEQRAAFPSDSPGSSLIEISARMEKHAASLHGKVACFDIEKNGLSFLALLWASEPAESFRRFKAALAPLQAQLYDANPALIDALKTGKAVLGLNVLGSFAARALREDPLLKVSGGSTPRLGISRIALITREAANPSAAGLFIDYLLSDAGQLNMLKDELFPLRWPQPINEFPPFSIQALAINQGFERFLDPQRRAKLLDAWQGIWQPHLDLTH